MQVTAWNNGSHHATGAGYGFKLRGADRDQFFDRSWSIVFVRLPGVAKEVEVNVMKPSFWGACRELISCEFGLWLREHDHAPWTSGRPPKFDLERVHGNHFAIAAE